MNSIKKIRLIGLFCLIGWLANVIDGFAAEDPAGFSVKTEPSVYQVDKTKTYFDLSVPTNELIPLTIHVTNDSEKNLTVAGEIHAATTNLNGVVEYGKTANQLTKNVPFDITKAATFVQSKQTIAPKQTVDFVVNLKVPTKEYAGVVAGGITLRDVTEDTNKEKKETFKNRFSYAIALLVHGDKTTEKNELTLKKVTPTQVNSRNVLSATIENLKANYIHHVSIKAKIVDTKGKEILSAQQKEIQLAPNSIFQFPIYYEKQEMKAGTYHMDLAVNFEKTTVHLKKTFTITETTAEHLNKTDVVDKSEPERPQWIIGGLIGVILFLLVILFVVFFKKLKAQKP